MLVQYQGRGETMCCSCGRAQLLHVNERGLFLDNAAALNRVVSCHRDALILHLRKFKEIHLFVRAWLL